MPVCIEVAVARASRSGGRRYASRKLRDENPVAAIERRFIDLLSFDYLTCRSFFGLNQRRRIGNGYGLRFSAWLEDHRHGKALLNVEMKILLGRLLKPIRFCREGVISDLDGSKDENAGAITYVAQCQTSFRRSESNLRVGNDGSRDP